MSIATRTPEGEPNRCPICGCEFLLEPSRPPGDAPCPACGHLVWWFEQRAQISLTLDDVLRRPIANSLEADSLEVVALVMELEEEFDVEIPAADAEKLHTLADAIAYIQKRRRLRNEAAGD